MALTYIVPVRYCMNRGSANGAPAGGAFLADIPEDWEPRAKQQPTGLIAYGAAHRRPVQVLLSAVTAKGKLPCKTKKTVDSLPPGRHSYGLGTAAESGGQGLTGCVC